MFTANVHGKMFTANVHGKMFREKVEPITTPPDKVFERPGLQPVKSFLEKFSNQVRRYSLFEIYLPIYVKYL